MTFLLVLKIIGVSVLVSAVIAAMAEWGPRRSREPWQGWTGRRRDPSFSHFLGSWAVGSIALAGLIVFVVWYLGPRR